MNSANIITMSRFVFSVLLVFSNPFTFLFYIIYLLAGVSNLLDGFAARKTNRVSELGSHLDSTADICFVLAILYKLLPVIQPPIAMYVRILVMTSVKILNIISGYLIYQKIMLLHTPLIR